MNDGIGIAEAARASGLTAHTLRYYERIGLIVPPPRDASGQRRYTEGDIGWLETLTKLRATGMPIATMLRYAELVRRGEHTHAARMGLLEEHRAEVVARINELQRDLKFLDMKISHYSGSALKESA